MKNALQRACLALSSVLCLAAPQAMANKTAPAQSPPPSQSARLQQLQAGTRALKAELLNQRLANERKTGHLLLLLASRGQSQPLRALSLSVDHGQAIGHTYTEHERRALAGGALQPMNLPEASRGKHVLHIRISAFDGHGGTRTWQTTKTFSFNGTKADTLLLSLNWASHPAGSKMPQTSLKAVP